MEITVAQDDDDIRLDRWFRRHQPQVAHGLLQKALRKGLVRVDNKKAEANTRVLAGQGVRFPDEWKTLESLPTKERTPISERAIHDLEQQIIYEDKHLLVLNKPAGLATQGGTGQKESVDAILAARAETRREAAPKLAHRLDRDTSGVLVLGKTANATAELAAAFAHKTAEKTYWALVIGVPGHAQGTIDLPLAKEGKVEKMRGSQDGKRAVTRYRILDQAGKKLAWLEMFPETGRTHQLRVHTEAIGHPILGDGKYGGAAAFLEGEEIPRKLHLHARRLMLPFKGKRLEFEAPLTGHMQKTFKLFEFEE